MDLSSELYWPSERRGEQGAGAGVTMGKVELTMKDEEGLGLQLSTSAPVTSLDRHTSTSNCDKLAKR